ncbi:MAG: type II secretion system protein [Patescibacteria group bacterium]
MEQNKNGFTLIEILTAVAIIAILSGITIARFGDFGAKKSFEREVTELVELTNISQSYANSQNSANCTTNDRLSYTKVQKTGENTYEVFMACETGFIGGGTPTVSPAFQMSPRINKSFTVSKFSPAMGGVGTDMVKFLPGAYTTPGPTIMLYAGAECACVKIDINGMISKTTKQGCVLDAPVATPTITCNSWE